MPVMCVFMDCDYKKHNIDNLLAWSLCVIRQSLAILFGDSLNLLPVMHTVMINL